MASATQSIEKTRRLEPHGEVEVVYPFPDYALPQLWDWLNKVRHLVADDDSPKTQDEFIDRELLRTQAGVKKFGVYRDEELGGCIWAEEVNRNVVMAHCCFKSDFYGHATTLPALLQMAEFLFLAGYRKIEMPCFDHNHGIKALLKRAGAHREGISRAHTTQDGKPIDVCLFAFFAEDMKAQDARNN